ncbi:NAD-dependent epimerase/dehydratase family protein [Anaerolineae bacterium CFX9]|jgi:uncharacterized protein YbjT (DUF2867 family)|nr:NAD-dependent epimerase/dehydratase family protein [Anaerolineae bacterium CFX9]
MQSEKRVLVTGGGTFVGDAIASALLAEGAEVTLLVRPGREEHLGLLADRVQWRTADVWEPSSLKGRARGQQVVIHTVGSLTAEPGRGLTHHYLNFVSTRNVANMCISGGVPHLIFLSAASALWINREYLHAKREAEEYLFRVGLKATIIRAPLLYARGGRRSLFHRLMSVLGVPPLGWLGGRRVAPMPVDVFARGVARLAMEPPPNKDIVYAGDLRRRNSRREVREGYYAVYVEPPAPDMPTPPSRPGIEFPPVSPDDTPLGWTPPTGRDDRER